MKKFLIFLIITCSVTIAFAGCISEEDDYSFVSYDPIESYDNVSYFTPEGTTASNDENNEKILVVKDKQYTYENNKIILVNVENQTDKNYSVTIVGSYLDESGKVLKTESKTFDQYAEGYQNYFLFETNIVFDKFSYTFEAKETDKPMYVTDLNMQLDCLREAELPNFSLAAQGDHTFYPTIIADFYFKNNSDTQLYVIGKWILLNENDEIVGICDVGTAVNPDRIETQQYSLYFTTEDQIIWPDKLKGEIRAVHALTSVETE